ncbi:rhodanese-like domain-containing protein [Roseomonas populi]|uniref:Rhodanese-like domain-containing protein n=1 Tax=Roseomonas populi TaxID=3121582 RepID=A0ABT1WYX2_9PROT|nr:rhodanese-like domain-containing protein [Roseomonas pecuniae]MCR0981052.1 rhodanese-like domain-containing protein [Roseomonas pecuniae]
MRLIDAPTLKAWLHDGAEIALLDVREHGQYGEAHPFYAVPLPYSRLELDVGRLVPRPATRIVLLDEGDGVAARAAARLEALGYGAVHSLEGGAAAWKAAGYELFAGVNVPSKSFGEMAEHVYHTPHITAPELAARQARGDRLVVLDGRPVDEYRKMTIPGSICCPNGELPLRIAALAPDPETTIVVNCAGRTRSIIGAQTLRHFGVPNPVLALENGTQGWYLADLPLDHGADRLYPAPSGDLAAARERAGAHAERAGVTVVDAAILAIWAADPARNTFLCDVRTPEEFAAGSLPGAQSTPGGQLLQATDQYVGVRGARLVLFDGEGVRAPMTAAWLRQMGWEAFVLAEGLGASLPAPSPAAVPALPDLVALDVAGLPGLVAAGAALLDLRPSMTFRAGHIAGARWAIRPRLDGVPAPAGALVLIAAEEGVARLAALDLAERGIVATHWHKGDPAAWRAAGLAVEATPQQPADSQAIDFLFFVHDRHSGNKVAARQYLAWELGLIEKLDERERAAWRFLPTS